MSVNALQLACTLRSGSCMPGCRRTVFQKIGPDCELVCAPRMAESACPGTAGWHGHDMGAALAQTRHVSLMAPSQLSAALPR
jgi:hypothetical protein